MCMLVDRLCGVNSETVDCDSWVVRSVGSHGGALTDLEIEWAVLCLEETEARMSAMDFSVAADILERVLGRCVVCVCCSRLSFRLMRFGYCLFGVRCRSLPLVAVRFCLSFC